MTTRIFWEGEVGEAWAAESARTDRSFAGLTQVLLERIAAQPGKAVLDIGCGAGELSLRIAAARPIARVFGVDVSPSLVATATSRGQRFANCRFTLADAANWHEPGFAPDLLVSRHGVMFFDNPPAAFAALRAQSAPEAALVFSCFRTPAENLWASGPGSLPGGELALAGGTAPGPFAFADPAHVTAILEQAGWTSLAFEPVDFRYVVGAGSDPVGDALAFFHRIGPVARALRETPEVEREALRERIAGWLGENFVNGDIGFPAAAWIVTARSPD